MRRLKVHQPFPAPSRSVELVDHSGEMFCMFGHHPSAEYQKQKRADAEHLAALTEALAEIRDDKDSLSESGRDPNGQDYASVIEKLAPFFPED